jgi:sugar phosphate isomerase/epimerase
VTIAPGLCSITLRALPADDVVTVAARAGVEGIEWGADRHAPPGGGPGVGALGTRCRDAGIEIASYGSYLGAGAADDAGTVSAVLDSAEALGAPTVRIWTELGVTPASPRRDRDRVVERTAALADAIGARRLSVALEFHPGTLTHTAAATNALLDALDRPHVRTHWQPDPALAAGDAVAEVRAVTDRLAHLHVFAWGPGGIAERYPLAEGAAVWRPALATVAERGAPLPGRRFALCEYVRDDDPDQLVADVATLRVWLAGSQASRAGQ